MTDLANDTAIAHHAALVQAARLPKAQWTHAGHFAYALWCLRHAPGSATPEAMRETIMALNDAHGTPNTDSAGYPTPSPSPRSTPRRWCSRRIPARRLGKSSRR